MNQYRVGKRLVSFYWHPRGWHVSWDTFEIGNLLVHCGQLGPLRWLRQELQATPEATDE